MTLIHFLRRWLLAILAIVIAAFVLLPSTTYASATPDLPTGGADGTLLTITAPILTLIVALVVPILNGLLTKAATSSWVKGLLTLLLNGVYSIIATATQADGTAVFGEQMVFTWALGFLISVASYLGIYRGAGLTSSSAIDVNGVEVAGKLANVGVK